ncbi:FAD-binding domain-containing protein [Aspergillus crustosus]
MVHLRASLLLAVIASAIPSAYSLGHGDTVTALFGRHLSPNATIFLPSDPDWETDVTQRWSNWSAPSYFGAIKPATEKDVQNIVKIAAKNNIPFLATGGGHGTNIGYGTVKNALNIDLSNFKSVKVDAANHRLTVGGAVGQGDIWGPLYEVGQEIPTGNAECVGLVGVTLGGGLGTQQGVFGLALDALVSVRLVTASGDLIEVSTEKHPDLFWALRGAGANFGIVTSATYKTYDAVNDGLSVTADFVYTAEKNRTIWEFLHSFDDESESNFPPELSWSFSVGYNRETAQATILVNIVYKGPVSDAQPYLDRLTAFVPLISDLNYVTWPEVGQKQFFGNNPSACQDNLYINWYGLGLGQTDVPTFEGFFGELVAFLGEHEAYAGSFSVQRYTSKNTVSGPSKDTVFPWRDTKTQLLFQNRYTDPSLDGEVDAFMKSARAKFQATSGFSHPQVYVNFNHGDEGPAAWYGAHNLPRLVALKKKWDPRSLFGKGSPVPTHL